MAVCGRGEGDKGGENEEDRVGFDGFALYFGCVGEWVGFDPRDG